MGRVPLLCAQVIDADADREKGEQPMYAEKEDTMRLVNLVQQQGKREVRGQIDIT